MAVVMLTEGCKRCTCQDHLYQHLINRMQSNDRSCGCYLSEAPLLSSWWDRFTSWTRRNICPACHRVIDNAGDFIVNLSNFGASIPDYANYLTGSAVQGVGGFVSDPKNIPCAAGMIGAAFGAPMGLGGCTPQGHNEQKFFQQQGDILNNPLILYGFGAIALILLLK